MSAPASPPPDVSVLVVGYRSRELVGDCLASVAAGSGHAGPPGQRDPSLEVLFVDQSGDGSEALVAREHPDVAIVPSRGNLGFAGGVNLLAARATGRHLLLLNPDVVVGEGAVATLAAYLDAHPSCGVAGGLVELPDGRIDAGCLQDPPTLRHQLLACLGRARYRRLEPLARERDVLPVPTPSGAFLMLRRADFRAVGGMDESFFLYSEEVDLCRRVARELGKEILLVTAARVRHDRGASHGGAGERQLAMWRGKMRFERKHHGRLHRLAMGALLWKHAALRYALGLGLAPLSPARAAALRERFGPLVLRPGSWLGGYASGRGDR